MRKILFSAIPIRNVAVGAAAAEDVDIDAFTYVKTHDPTSNQTSVNGLNFKPDGTKMYVADNSRIETYALSTPWDPSTVTSQSSMPNLPVRVFQFLTFNAAGTRAYYYNVGSTDFLRSQDLSVAFDLTTASNAAAGGIGSSPNNGSSMLLLDNEQDFYLLDSGLARVYHRIMSVAGDVTAIPLGPTGSGGALDFSAEGNTANTMDFSPSGTKLYIGMRNTTTIFQYNMSVPFDISTATYSGKSLSLGALTFFHGMHIRKDTGSTLFVQHGDNSNFFVDEYSA